VLVVLEEYAACRLLLLERERGVGEIDEDPREITYSMFLLKKKLVLSQSSTSGICTS
jgi:hypothetical protein